MAANKRKYKTDRTREKIKTGRLLCRLQAFLLGENDPTTKKPVKLTSTEIRGIEVLLRKTMPDLTSADILNRTEPETTSPEELLEKFEKSYGQQHGARVLALVQQEITPEQFAKEVLHPKPKESKETIETELPNPETRH